MKKELILLGIRGVPAEHGGFETFAEYLCLYLIENGWKVTVYCQESGGGNIYESQWEGVQRIHIPVRNEGPLGTIIFDFKSIVHSLRHSGVFLTLGYNTAIFNILHRLVGKKNIINMDGIEWKRQKWSGIGKLWFWLNERFGCWFGNHLVADHPEILNHLATRVSKEKITMIAYGAEEVLSSQELMLEEYGLDINAYAILVARAEPENSILEVVQAFSKEKRGYKLVVLGDYSPDTNPYHKLVLSSASDEVLFLGAIYESDKVNALRFYSRFYIHGHQVGGTNPSLVEALGAGNAVLAHDNKFNKWVVGDSALYFNSVASAEEAISRLFQQDSLIRTLQENARLNFNKRFKWNEILKQYETLLFKWLE